MKTKLFLCVAMATLARLLPAQDILLQYRICENCSSQEGGDHLTTDYTYGGLQPYQSEDVTSDFGARYTGYDWHKGVDFRPKEFAGTNDGGRGTAIVAAETGEVIRIVADRGYKYVIVDGDEDFGYGHIFNSRNPTEPHLQSGSLVLKKMDLPSSEFAIIDLNTGVAIGPVEGAVTLDQTVYTVDTEISSTNQIIAAMGGSGGVNYQNNDPFPVHLHLYRFQDISSNPLINEIFETNCLDPLGIIAHDEPDYEVKFHSNGEDFGAVILNYPGSAATKFRVRAVMQNATNTDGTVIGENGSATRYGNVVMNLDNIQLLLKPAQEDEFQEIRGSQFYSRISHGALDDSEMYPPYLALNNQRGNWNRQGIAPFAYTNHPYDDFYFTDFITRIHTEDPMDGGAAQLAACPLQARYNDGDYEIKAVATDVRGNAHESEAVAFTLDNFQPYISSFTFNANGITQYTRNWSCSDCGVSLTTNPFIEANQSDWNAWLHNPTLLLSVSGSEPLEMLTLDIVVEGNVLQEDIQGIPFPNGIDWNFDISQYAAQLSGKVEFIFYGHDTNGNALLAFSPSQQSCVSVPTRTGEDSWHNPDNISTGPDKTHAVCIDCGGRSPDGDCAVIALVPDEECLEVEAEITNASGDNASDGSINLTISGGALPYQFSWSNGSATEDISGLAPGSYAVTITDALCCTTTRRYNVTGCQRVSPAFVHGEVTEASGAGNNGAIDITLININTSAPMSSSSFNFQWTGPNGFTSSNEDVAGLAPGNYCVEVREKRFGCLVTSRCFSVCGSMILGIQHNGFIDCEGERGTFELMLLEQNVAAPYEIQWSNGATSALNENLVPGIYCATVTDANGCTDQTCLRMRVNFPIDLSGQVENAACNNTNGSIVLMASSSNSEITAYQWSNGSTTQNLEGLAAGEYCVTVTNSKGCEKTACFTVENIELIVGLESIVNPFMCSEPPCVEEAGCTSDGAIDIRVQSNVSGVTYQWSGPDGFNASSEDISGLTPGTYTVTASTGGCSISKSFTLHPCYEEEYIENNPYDPPGCETQANTFNFIAPDGAVSPVENGCDGAVELSYSGIGLYFSWSGPDGFVSSEKSIYNLCEGKYCVTVSNGCGLQKENCFEIVDCNTQNLSLSGHASNSCPGYEAGSITINASGGAAPYEYAWSNGYSVQNLQGVPSGNYCVTVTDVHGCRVSNCYTVGSEETVTQWVGCTEVVRCAGSIVSEIEYPRYYVPSTLGCEFVDEYCAGNNAFLQTIEAPQILEYAGNCIIERRNQITGQLCGTYYGELTNGYNYGFDEEAGCWRCDFITYCQFNDPDLGGAVVVILDSESHLAISFDPNIECGPGNCYVRIYCGWEIIGQGCDAGCDEISCAQDYYPEEIVVNQVVDGNNVEMHIFSGRISDEAAFQQLIKSGSVPSDALLLSDYLENAKHEEIVEGLTETQKQQVEIYPNPFNSDFVIEFSLNYAQTVIITVFNSIGQRIYYSKVEGAYGKNSYNVNLSDEAKGIYFLGFEDEAGKMVYKLIKH